MWDLSSLIRNWTWFPCIARWILNHWITREVPDLFFNLGIYLGRLYMSGNVDLSHFFLTSAWYFFIWMCQCLFNISHVGGFLHCFEYFASILKKQTIHSRRYIPPTAQPFQDMAEALQTQHRCSCPPFPAPTLTKGTSPPWLIRLRWPHTVMLSLIELDKAVVHVIRLDSFLWLWFQPICPLCSSKVCCKKTILSQLNFLGIIAKNQLTISTELTDWCFYMSISRFCTFCLSIYRFFLQY